jgi:hypothetical protein
MAVLDVTDLTVALIDGPGGAPHTVPGPHAPGTDPCDDPACLTAAVWVWVLGWRGTLV